MLHTKIKKTVVLSLEEDYLRRNHIRSHFLDIGISNFSFFKAVESTDNCVAELYSNGKVKVFPSCFRCGEEACNCQNNILIPQQIANWLSFINIWESLKNDSGYFLICEDDVVFHENAIPLLNEIIEQLPSEDNKVLLRLVESGQEPNKVLNPTVPLELSDDVVMSNAAYIVSVPMINHILNSFMNIEHTSDVWLHKQFSRDSDIHSLTVQPLIGTDLSFNKEHATFLSRIHPKGINKHDEDRVVRHIKRVESCDEYHAVRSGWIEACHKNHTEKDVMISPIFETLKKKQIDLIKAIPPSSVKRKYSGQIDALYEKEYGFSYSFEEWKSCDVKGAPIPWMTYSSIYYLNQLDLSHAHIFEWGCGGSSHYFSARASSVTSIESNIDWYDHVLEEKAKNHKLHLMNSDDYANSILEQDKLFDVISIDGDIYRRLECAVLAINKLKPGGLLILDNSDWLEETCLFLRESGFTQIDFAGPGPINNYMWCTSIFFKGNISIPSAAGKRPESLKTGITNKRDLPFSVCQNSEKLDDEHKARYLSENYININKHFIPSYADIFSSQEGEDILIKRLLKWHYNQSGTFVDIGAHHPVRFSNTYHYYLKGWRGINVDPRPGFKNMFDKVRPGDTNLECGVANQNGELIYYEFKEPAFNTFCKDSIIYAKTRTDLINESVIPVQPLSQILNENLTNSDDVTFMNIDVEGLEVDVLKSSDWQRFRPKIVCIEALDDSAFLEINKFMCSVNYLKVASTKNSFFFCEKTFWEEVK